MRIRPNLLAAGVGFTVLLAVGVPAAAYAQGASTPSASTAAAATTCPGQKARTAVATYLAAHPGVAAEVAELRTLPADQRAAARKAYLTQHTDVAQALHDLRVSAGADGASRLAAVGDFLAAHPDVAGLFDQLRTAAGQRRQVAADHLTAHPQTRGELRDALTQLRRHARSCRAGGN